MTALFSHLALTVADLDRVRAFYCDVFGFIASSHRYEGRGRRLSQVMEVDDAVIAGVFLRKDGFCLELLGYESALRTRPLPLRDDELGFCHLSFIVDDMSATAIRITQAGGEFRVGTSAEFDFGGGAVTMIAFCIDPEGNRVELIQHNSPAARSGHAAFLGAGEIGWPLESGG